MEGLFFSPRKRISVFVVCVIFAPITYSNEVAMSSGESDVLSISIDVTGVKAMFPTSTKRITVIKHCYTPTFINLIMICVRSVLL